MYGLSIKHNIEVAHRLTKLGGKCENIHGHSMWVTLHVFGPSALDDKDVMAGLDFGGMKKVFRQYLDEGFDHRLLLGNEDPLLQMADERIGGINPRRHMLPGLRIIQGDPTTENLAAIIGKRMRDEFGLEFSYRCTVDETAVNSAFWEG